MLALQATFQGWGGFSFCYNLRHLQEDYVIIGSSEIHNRFLIVRLQHTSTSASLFRSVLMIFLFHASSDPRRHELPEGVVLIISTQHLVQRQRTWHIFGITNPVRLGSNLGVHDDWCMKQDQQKTVTWAWNLDTQTLGCLDFRRLKSKSAFSWSNMFMETKWNYAIKNYGCTPATARNK